MRKRWPFLLAAPRHMAKKKSFRSGPRIVRDNDRCTLLIRLVYAICFSLQDAVFQVPGKSQDRKFAAAMAIPTPKSTLASTRFEAPSPKAKVSPATTIATRDSPRAIVLVNACCRRLTAFSQGDWPPTCANAAEDQRRISLGRLSSLPASSFQMMRAGHRIGIQGQLSPDLVEQDGERREPKVEVAASRREAALELHEYSQSPVAES